MLLAAWLGLSTAQAALQFDVFLGYGGQPTGMDGAVHEDGWFGLGCEVHNDGPAFNAVVEVNSADGGQGQTRRIAVELPTNTRKRFVIPVFASGRGGAWDVRLLDDRGKVRAEVNRVGPRSVAWEGLLMGAVPRSFGGTPRFPNVTDDPRNDLQPVVARLPVEFLPDNPIAYEGLNALYLSSEKAVELKQPQVEALTSWLHTGGHLILGVEQPADVNATPWLRNLVPCVLGDSTTAKATQELYDWLHWNQGPGEVSTASAAPPGVNGRTAARYRVDRPLNAEEIHDNPYRALRMSPKWTGTEFQVVSARLRDGRVVLEMDHHPLVVAAARGRGRITVLLFSPDREPFRSWEDRDWFWARLLRVPPQWFRLSNLNLWGGYSLDGVVGTMIDSRQVQKLPVEWLLLLLLAYLVVIGPLDRYILKRLNRQMLTWVTFPAYVVLFSLLIYYIGYRLRAGETEWNELHVVDIIPRTVGAELRGRTYASLYSPVNDRYPVSSDLPQATLRGEYQGSYGANRESGRIEYEQLDQGFRAQVFVPVWSSQLIVCEWVKPDRPPLEVTLVTEGSEARVTVKNNLDRPLQAVSLAIHGRATPLGTVPAGQTVESRVALGTGLDLMQQVYGLSTQFRMKVDARQQALRAAGGQWLDLDMSYLQALSFAGLAEELDSGQRQCVAPEGADLTPLLDRGDAVLLAMVQDYAAVPSLRRFEAVRSQQNSLFRVAVPIGSGPSQ